MTMISYAQNYEDVMLWRALKDIEKGFYIDVGANDPVIDSVTKAFYEAGWRGINIEPVDEWYGKLLKDRPEDTNLKVAVGARKDELNFYEVVGTGLSTLDGASAKEQAEKLGFDIKASKVPVQTLTAICGKYADTEIHFLKIDVEGHEEAVLQGLDLKKIRPWIILLESTMPNSQKENYEDWESSLTGQGYHHVYFDGLNRYYVADEHDELDTAFSVPPNLFDDFVRESEYHVQLLNEKLAAAKARSAELDAVYKSMSWRITGPLRRLVTLWHKLSRGTSA